MPCPTCGHEGDEIGPCEACGVWFATCFGHEDETTGDYLEHPEVAWNLSGQARAGDRCPVCADPPARMQAQSLRW